MNQAVWLLRSGYRSSEISMHLDNRLNKLIFAATFYQVWLLSSYLYDSRSCGNYAEYGMSERHLSARIHPGPVVVTQDEHECDHREKRHEYEQRTMNKCPDGQGADPHLRKQISVVPC